MSKTVWLKRSPEWIKENPGKGTMYKALSNQVQYNDPILLDKAVNNDKKPKQVPDIGIYVIVCEAEKCVYIGQSINMGTRLRSHKLAILSESNKSAVYKLMKEHYTKNGANCFEFRRLLFFPDGTDLTEHENKTMHKYTNKGYKLYNINIGYNMYCPPEHMDKVKQYIASLTNL